MPRVPPESDARNDEQGIVREEVRIRGQLLTLDTLLRYRSLRYGAPIRVEFEGAVYHVTARGNDREPIDHDDRDRERFLETLEETVERFGFVTHAYCQMPNHFHLLAQTPRAILSDAVGWPQVT